VAKNADSQLAIDIVLLKYLNKSSE